MWKRVGLWLSLYPDDCFLMLTDDDDDDDDDENDLDDAASAAELSVISDDLWLFLLDSTQMQENETTLD